MGWHTVPWTSVYVCLTYTSVMPGEEREDYAIRETSVSVNEGRGLHLVQAQGKIACFNPV